MLTMLTHHIQGKVVVNGNGGTENGTVVAIAQTDPRGCLQKQSLY